MTLNDATDQIHSLSSVINGEEFSLERMTSQFKSYFKYDNTPYYFFITLPDGEWLSKIIKFQDNSFDYIIPCTRKQEAYFMQELINKSKNFT